MRRHCESQSTRATSSWRQRRSSEVNGLSTSMWKVVWRLGMLGHCGWPQALPFWNFGNSGKTCLFVAVRRTWLLWHVVFDLASISDNTSLSVEALASVHAYSLPRICAGIADVWRTCWGYFRRWEVAWSISNGLCNAAETTSFYRGAEFVLSWRCRVKLMLPPQRCSRMSWMAHIKTAWSGKPGSTRALPLMSGKEVGTGIRYFFLMVIWSSPDGMGLNG